ncbi:MAG: nucleotide exchange factor GrpE [Planctomycetes bacterium]|nr:nucleotide exchange factor GrpE [Planctomycetota bacterium]
MNNSEQPEETTEAETPAVQAQEHTDPIQLSYAQYEEFKTLARERDEYLKRLQRAVADYQNLQKRIEKFRIAARQSALRELGEAILPVADSLALALASAEQIEGAEEIVKGFRLVEKDFYAALEKLNIRPIEAVGLVFDPQYHEAVIQEETHEAPPNRVLREMKKGFMVDQQVIRPSRVVVSGPKRKDDGES